MRIWLCGPTWLIDQLETETPPYEKLSRIIDKRRRSLVSTQVIGAVIRKCFRTQNWFEVDGLTKMLTMSLQESVTATENMLWTVVSSLLTPFRQHQVILIQEIFVNGGMQVIPNDHDYATTFDEKFPSTCRGFDPEKLLQSALSLQSGVSQRMAWKAFAAFADYSNPLHQVHEERFTLLLQSLFELIMNNIARWQDDGKFYALKGLGTLGRYANKKFSLPLSMKDELSACRIDFGRTGQRLGKSFSLQVMFDFC